MTSILPPDWLVNAPPDLLLVAGDGGAAGPLLGPPGVRLQPRAAEHIKETQKIIVQLFKVPIIFLLYFNDDNIYCLLSSQCKGLIEKVFIEVKMV